MEMNDRNRKKKSKINVLFRNNRKLIFKKRNVIIKTTGTKNAFFLLINSKLIKITMTNFVEFQFK